MRSTASKEQRKFQTSDENQPCASAVSFRPFLQPVNFRWLDLFSRNIFQGIVDHFRD